MVRPHFYQFQMFLILEVTRLLHKAFQALEITTSLKNLNKVLLKFQLKIRTIQTNVGKKLKNNRYLIIKNKIKFLAKL